MASARRARDDDAIALLRRETGTKLDADCVDALRGVLAEVRAPAAERPAAADYFGPSGTNSAGNPSRRNQLTIFSCGGFSMP